MMVYCVFTRHGASLRLRQSIGVMGTTTTSGLRRASHLSASGTNGGGRMKKERDAGNAVRGVSVRTCAASSSSGPTTEERIKSLNAEHKVVIYSKSWCPFCSEVKRVFENLETTYLAVELDEIEEGQDIQDALLDMTGMRTVPQVFVSGTLIGGCDGKPSSVCVCVCVT